MAEVSESELQAIVRTVIQKITGASATNPNQGALIPALDASKSIAIGSDHGGFALKESIKPFLSELGFIPVDCGTNDKNPVDYPDFAHSVAQLVSSGKARFGIMIDGAGIGSCMVANKVPGIRASLCYDISSASNSREHNNANYLTLGAGLIGENLAKQIVKTWLTTEFGGGRHAKRVEKISNMERQYFKG